MLKNKAKKGYHHCQNLVIQKSNSSFIVQVDSDGLIIDKLAFRKLLDKIKKSPKTGMVHCYYLKVDRCGYITRDKVVRDWRILHNNFATNIDYTRELFVRGNFFDAIKIYRKDIFNRSGYFNEKLGKSNSDWEMAVRLLDEYDVQLVSEFLYAKRSSLLLLGSSSATKFVRLKRSLRSLRNRKIIISDLAKTQKVKYYSFFSKHNIYFLSLLGIYRAFRISYFDPYKKINSYFNSLNKYFKYTYRDFCKGFYSFILDHFSWWPIEFILYDKSLNNNSNNENIRIAYYLRNHPVFSQTFIYREIEALKESRVPVNVFADNVGEIHKLDEHSKSQIKETVYLETLSRSDLTRYKLSFLLRNPFRYFNLFLYIIFHKHERNKSYKKDKEIFNYAILLSGLLKENQIDHIHSPWANKSAFIALVAAKFTGIEYSVQGRAYDITRADRAYGLREKFENAKFVVINSEYNINIIKNILNDYSKDNLKLIYNECVDVKDINPAKTKTKNKIFNILCVGRYVEQKGLIYLLSALKLVKDKGYNFSCDLVGGKAENEAAYYTKLKIIHKNLGLADSVNLCGALPFEKVRDKYHRCDLFVLPCVIGKKYGSRDNIPNAIIEAMAMRLPVISTNIVGIPEIIDNGKDGILVLPEDETSLADAIIQLMDDENLREHLGANARKKIEEKFDINKNIKKFAELFNYHL